MRHKRAPELHYPRKCSLAVSRLHLAHQIKAQDRRGVGKRRTSLTAWLRVAAADVYPARMTEPCNLHPLRMALAVEDSRRVEDRKGTP